MILSVRLKLISSYALLLKNKRMIKNIAAHVKVTQLKTPKIYFQ